MIGSLSLEALCRAIQYSPIGTAIRESIWLFPIVETTHVLGVSLSVGLILMLDLRLAGIGLGAATPLQIIRQLKPWYLSGFTLMFFTGGLLFWAEAFNCYKSPAFRWKLVFLLLAGLNAAVFEVLYKPTIEEWRDPSDAIPWGARLTGWCSLVCWAAVIGFGRWTAYHLG